MNKFSITTRKFYLSYNISYKIYPYAIIVNVNQLNCELQQDIGKTSLQMYYSVFPDSMHI